MVECTNNNESRVWAARPIKEIIQYLKMQNTGQNTLDQFLHLIVGRKNAFKLTHTKHISLNKRGKQVEVPIGFGSQGGPARQQVEYKGGHSCL
jgi:hypothetical protein